MEERNEIDRVYVIELLNDRIVKKYEYNNEHFFQYNSWLVVCYIKDTKKFAFLDLISGSVADETIQSSQCIIVMLEQIWNLLRRISIVSHH